MEELPKGSDKVYRMDSYLEGNVRDSKLQVATIVKQVFAGLQPTRRTTLRRAGGAGNLRHQLPTQCFGEQWRSVVPSSAFVGQPATGGDGFPSMKADRPVGERSVLECVLKTCVGHGDTEELAREFLKAISVSGPWRIVD